MAGTRSDFYKKHWAKKRARIEGLKAAGRVEVRTYHSRIHVIVPDEVAPFRLAALDLGGRWRKKTGIWSFSIKLRRPLAGLITEHFGSGAVPLWMREGEK